MAVRNLSARPSKSSIFLKNFLFKILLYFIYSQQQQQQQQQFENLKNHPVKVVQQVEESQVNLFCNDDLHSNNPETNLKQHRSSYFDSWVCSITKDISRIGGDLEVPLIKTKFEMHFAMSLILADIVPSSADEGKELKAEVLCGLSDLGINVVDEI